MEKGLLQNGWLRILRRKLAFELQLKHMWHLTVPEESNFLAVNARSPKGILMILATTSVLKATAFAEKNSGSGPQYDSLYWKDQLSNNEQHHHWCLLSPFQRLSLLIPLNCIPVVSISSLTRFPFSTNSRVPTVSAQNPRTALFSLFETALPLLQNPLLSFGRNLPISSRMRSFVLCVSCSRSPEFELMRILSLPRTPTREQIKPLVPLGGLSGFMFFGSIYHIVLVVVESTGYLILKHFYFGF